MVTKLSPRPVAETISRLLAALESKGIKLFAVIDHGAEAKAAGLALRDELAARLAAIDLVTDEVISAA